MKTKTRNILAGAAVAVLLGGAFGGIATLGNHKAVAEGQGSALDLLNGFTCPGASVYISGAGESIAKQMRFVLNLDAAQAAYADEAHTAGVVVLPYDLYRKYNLSELTKDSEIASKVDVKWEKQENGSYTSYAYLDATLIPAGQENRTLVARGYIEDGTNVYYTEEVKASMAYVAWKNIGMQGGAYDTQLKEYMGEYTLTYGAGENEKIGGLYYGDTFYTQLPAQVGGYNVDKWYWDEEKTQKIEAADYATGSMKIYYELEKFAVTGTISCADGIDLTKVKVYVNGEDTGAAVSESGIFSIQLPAGKHDFVFETEGYIAYADGVEVSATTEAINATLKKNTWVAGDYKNTKTTATSSDKNAMLDGVITVTGKTYGVLFPNTATEGDFTFTANTEITEPAGDERTPGLAITNGTNVLSFAVRKWGQVVVYAHTAVADSAWLTHSTGYWADRTWTAPTLKIVRTKNSIDFYVNNELMISADSTGIVGGIASRNTNVTAEDKLDKNKFAGFFGENVEVACGVAAVSNQSAKVKYTCSIINHYAVSGTISAADGVDLTATSLTVDGISTPISVQENGSYSVLIAEGKHTLVFANGKYGATKEITVVNGENIADVQLKDGTWLAGNYGNVTSNNTPELNENGTYTVSGKDQMIIFPNTATSNSFTYEVNVSNVDRNDASDRGYGICITDGKYVLSVFVYSNSNIVIPNLNTAAGSGLQSFYQNNQTNIANGGKVKFVVSSEKIAFYAGEDCIFEFTKDTFTHPDTVMWGIDNLPKNDYQDYKNAIAGFFADGATIACGISSGMNGSVTATYTCKLQKN